MDLSELIRKEGYKRGLREKTIKTYVCCVNYFFRICKIDPKSVKKSDIENFIGILRKWNKSDNTVNVYVNSLKFFYEKILHKRLTVNIAHTRVRKKLPDFLTRDEIKRLFRFINNASHRLMISFLYATGMRVNELVSLKVKDFEFDNNYGWVRDGKGGKDRLFIVSLKLKDELNLHIMNNGLKHNDWLFLGNNASHYSVSSIQSIIKKAAKNAGIKKNVHPHTLRHSFATHLIENGYAVTDVQPLLGHSSITTTMIYLHMASPQLLKVKSPFDTLDEY